MTTDPLARAGQLRARHKRALQRSEEQLYALIVAAHFDGVPIAVIARLAGVSRQTVYTVIGRSGT